MVYIINDKTTSVVILESARVSLGKIEAALKLSDEVLLDVDTVSKLVFCASI